MAAPYTPTPEAFECVGFADFVVDVAGHRVTGPVAGTSRCAGRNLPYCWPSSTLRGGC